MPIILQSLSSFAQAVSPYAKLSYHQTLVSLQFTITWKSISMDPTHIHPIQYHCHQNNPSCTSSSSIQVIGQTIRHDPPTHDQVAQVYQHQKAFQYSKQIKHRNDDVRFSRLRSSRHLSLHHYLHRLDPTQDPMCLSCLLDEQILITGFGNILQVAA